EVCRVSTTTSPRSLDAQSPADVGSGTPRHRRLLVAAAGLAGAWLLPFVTHLVGIDLILPPLLLLGVMSLVQGGRNVVDQFVVAVSVLFGVLCLAALGISAWPWGLHPVPFAGLASSALVTTAVLTRL